MPLFWDNWNHRNNWNHWGQYSQTLPPNLSYNLGNTSAATSEQTAVDLTSEGVTYQATAGFTQWSNYGSDFFGWNNFGSSTFNFVSASITSVSFTVQSPTSDDTLIFN